MRPNTSPVMDVPSAPRATGTCRNCKPATLAFGRTGHARRNQTDTGDDDHARHEAAAEVFAGGEQGEHQEHQHGRDHGHDD